MASPVPCCPLTAAWNTRLWQTHCSVASCHRWSIKTDEKYGEGSRGRGYNTLALMEGKVSPSIRTTLNRGGKAIGLRVEGVTYSSGRWKKITIYLSYCWWETGSVYRPREIIAVNNLCVHTYVRGGGSVLQWPFLWGIATPPHVAVQSGWIKQEERERAISERKIRLTKAVLHSST